MALTALQMSNEVLDNISRASVSTTRSLTTLATMSVRWLNRAQVKVYRQYDILYKIETASTVASQQSYSFPNAMNVLYSLRLENGLQSLKLECIMPWEADQRIPKPSNFTSRQPVYYVPYKLSNTFELFPIPDIVYTMRLRCSVIPSDLTIASTQSDYSDVLDIDDVLIYYATAEAFYWLQEFADGSNWTGRGDKALKDAIESTESWPDWAPISHGFSARGPQRLGEYYNDPFVKTLAGY